MKSDEIEKLLQDDDVTNSTERSETYQELLEQGRSEFSQSSLKLHSILKGVADSLLADEKLTKQQAQRYHVSGRYTISILCALSVWRTCTSKCRRLVSRELVAECVEVHTHTQSGGGG